MGIRCWYVNQGGELDPVGSISPKRGHNCECGGDLDQDSAVLLLSKLLVHVEINMYLRESRAAVTPVKSKASVCGKQRNS